MAVDQVVSKLSAAMPIRVRRLRQRLVQRLAQWLAQRLQHWSAWLQEGIGTGSALTALPETPSEQAPVALVEALSPGLRPPLSVEAAVLQRDMTVLRREAADCLAALGAAHALVTSARFTQLQELRQDFSEGEEVPVETLAAMSADYQGWHNDQVRLFDALGLVLRMRVPQGKVLEQLDPAFHAQARSHLETLSLEYQRGQLNAQFNG